MGVVCCWVSSARYQQPLDLSIERKFRALSPLGQLFVIGFSGGYRPARFTRHADFYLLPWVPIPFLRYLSLLSLGTLLTLWLVLTKKVQVLITQGPYEGTAAALVKQIAALCGKRVVVIVESHGDYERSLFLQRRVPFEALYRWLMRRGAQYALRHADALRPVSDAAREQLLVKAPGTPVVQFAAWIDIDTFFTAQRAIPVSRARDILYVGVLVPRKGVHFLLEAFSRIADGVPSSRLILIGNAANPRYTESLKEMVARLGLGGRVAFLGELPQPEMAQHMARARVLVLPSLSEGLPRVVIEAMACGTPVISTPVGGIPQMIRDGVTGRLAPPEDVEALAACLHWTLTCDAEVEEMARTARDAVHEIFSTETYVSGHRRLFEIACRELVARR